MRKIYFLLLTILFAAIANAQVTGTKTIGVDYPNLAAAITALNTTGVGVGGAIINVPAGYTETAPSGGFLLGTTLLNASLSAANTLVFQKSGAGVNPLLTAFTGGSSTTSDGIFKLQGTDYITIDGIDVKENVANSGAAFMEWGYALVNLNGSAPFDGCQNVTIKNCSVTLNRTNPNGAFGIYSAHNTATSSTALTITAAGDLHSNNRFYSNTINNINEGIWIIGFNAASPYTLYDQNNDVGGSSLATGNTILNGGTNATYNFFGIYLTYQNGANASFNTVNNAGGGGAGNNTNTYGIYFFGTTSNATANNNTVTLTQATGAFSVYGIYPANTGNITVNNNTIKEVTTGSTSSIYYHIYMPNTAVSETVNNNIFDNSNINTTSTVYFIYTSNSTPSITISGNNVNGGFTRTSSGSTYCVYNFGSPASGTSTITNNNFSNFSTTGTGSTYGIYYFTGTGHSHTITGNTISNWTSNGGAGQMYGIYCATGFTNTISNNTVSNLTTTYNGTCYGIYAYAANTGTGSVNGNTVTGFTNGGSTLYGLYITMGAPTAANVFKNKISDITSSISTGGIAYGLYLSTATTANIYNNLIGNIYTPATTNTNGAVGLYIAGGTIVNAYYNSIYLSGTSTGSGFGTSGIYASTTPTVTLRNNLVSNQSFSTGTGRAVAYRRSSTTLTTYGASSNNNMWYSGGNVNNAIFFDGTTAQTTLSAFQTLVAPRDAASVTEISTPFLSTVGTNSNFLHISTTTPTVVESGGAAIGGYTDDYDGDTRNVTTPDIGADEFNGLVATACSGTPTAGTITGTNNVCAGQATVLTLTGYSVNTGISLQWQSSAVSGGPYVDITGATGVTYNTGIIPTGTTVYYVVKVTCSNGGGNATTVQFAVTSNPAPTITVNPPSPTICAGGSVSLTASGATTYTWSPATGLSGTTGATVTANPTTTTTYTVIGTNGFGCTNSTTVTVTVNPVPAISSITATPSSVCSGGSSQLNVNATSTVGYIVNPVTFAPIASGSGTTILCSGGVAVTPMTATTLDDGYWNGLTLPFTFNYYGTNYTTFNVQTNGVISFSPFTTTTGYGSSPQMPNVAAPNNMVGVFGDMDWRFGGIISCYTSGSAPNRIFIINYDGSTGGGFYNGGLLPTALVNYQIQLFENGNKIQFHTTSITTDASHNHTQGVEDATGATATVVSGRNNSLWSLSNDGTEIAPASLTYSWAPSTFLNNTTIANPLASNITATTIYTVTVSQSNGCSSTANTTVTMNSPIITGQTIVQPTSCVSNDGSITLTVTGGTSGGPFTYSWTGSGTGLNPTAQNQTGLSIGTYTVTITDPPSGCTTVQNFALPGPGGCICPTISSLTTNPTPTGCINTNVILNATGLANMGTSYGITFKYSTSPLADPYVGGTVITNVPNSSLTAGGTAASTTTTFATANTYYIYAVLFPTPPDPTCRPLQTVTLPVYGNPSFTSQPVNRTICSGQTTTFAVTTSGTPVTYQWQINQGAGFVNLSEVAPFSGTQTATLTVTGATTVYNGNTFRVILGPCGGATSNVVTLTVNPLPVVTVGPDGLCAPVTLIASGTSNTYSWSPATGLNTTTGSTVIATPAVNTTYTVTGTITATGCTNTATVNVRGNSTAAVLSGATTICNTAIANLVVTITGGVGPFTVVYNNGTSNVTVNGYNSGANIPVTPSSTTTYTLVSVTGANGCTGSGINTTPVTITVNPLPTIAVGPNNQCSPVTLTATGNSDTYSWSPATGLNTTTGAVVTATTTTTTTYTVTGRFTATGCTNTAQATVLGTPLAPVLSPTAANICLGGIVQLNATATPTATWSPATGLYTDNTATTPYVAGTQTNTVYAKPTTTTTYTVTSTSGTCPASTNITVTVTQPLSITTHPANQTVCAGATATFTVVAAGNLLNYQWFVSTDGGTTFTALTNSATTYNGVNTSTLTVSNTTTTMNSYRYRVVVSNSCGSQTSNSATLTVNALPVITATQLTNRICLSDSLVNLVATPIGGVWSGIGVYGNTFIPMRTGIGTYTLTYTFTNSNNCTNTATVIAKVEDCPDRVRELGDKGVLLYPNPNDGHFNLRVNSTLYNYLGIRVYTTAGSLVKIMTWSNLQYGRIIPIDLSRLPAAVYQVEVYYDDGARTAKKTFNVIITH